MLNNLIGQLRAITRLVLFIVGTVILVTIQIVWALPRLFSSSLARHQSPIVRLWYRYVLLIFGIRVRVKDRKKKTRTQALYLANHSSYLDILVLGAHMDCFFVAKSDIADWPIFGFLSKVGGTIFITRQRRFVKQQLALLKTHMESGQNLLIFPEGTTTNGMQIIPFKSSLLNCVYDVASPPKIQTLTVAYTHINNRPIQTQNTMDAIAWYADMTLAPHLWHILTQRSVHAVIRVGDMLRVDAFDNPKALAAAAQEQVESNFYALLPSDKS